MKRKNNSPLNITRKVLLIVAILFALHIGEDGVKGQKSKKRTAVPPLKITLRFTPDAKLHIQKFQWEIDGKLLDVASPTKNTPQVVMIQSKDKHHTFALRWSGEGYLFKTKVSFPSPIPSYRQVTAGFELTVEKDILVDLTAEIDEEEQGLEWMGKAGTKKFRPRMR